MKLDNMSATALRDLAFRATALAQDLEKEQPSYALALEHGVVSKGYNTVRHGWVSSYGGEAFVTMENGKRWHCKGRPPKGNAECIFAQGFIEFVPLED